MADYFAQAIKIAQESGNLLSPDTYMEKETRMDEIRVNRKDLLEVLRKNREGHRKIFLEACEGYREQAIKELEHMLDEARRGKKIRRAVALVEPMDQTKDYDRVIKIMEMHVDDVIELSEREFQCYVMDDWSWREQFAGSTANYVKSKSF